MAQDYCVGTIIGSTSVGKGTVQEIMNYSNGSILKLTVAKWLTPLARWIQDGEDADHGVIPDVAIPDPTPEEKKQEIDKQLEQLDKLKEVLQKEKEELEKKNKDDKKAEEAK